MSVRDHFNRKILGVRVMTAQSFKRCLAIIALMLTGSISATEITNIGFNVMPGDKVEIRVSMDTPPPSFREFTTNNPARIALDFTGVTSNCFDP